MFTPSMDGLFLFLGVALVHHSKAFIVNLARYIVLIRTNEKAVKFTSSVADFLKNLVGQHPKPFNNFIEIGYAPAELKDAF